jgi:hypothetical protein
MTPEQIQQTLPSMHDWFSMMPFWVKALTALQYLSYLVTVICLPLITWKLYFGNKPPSSASMTPAEQARLRQVRERRDALQKISSGPQHAPQPPEPSSEPDLSASGAGVPENPNDDSRFRPPE